MNEQAFGWALAVVMAIALAYTLQWTAATRAFGVESSDSGSDTGFQNAVTPPWQSKLAMATYIGCLIVIGAMWTDYGWQSGLGSIAVILFGAALAKQIMPKLNGEHYRRLILKSMISRYANFVRDGDVERADAMKLLLVRAGIDPDEMRGK